MPDPLLGGLLSFEESLAHARRVAGWFGASLTHEGRLVFLECLGAQGRPLLARIDCEGYPAQPPLVEFLDPLAPDRIKACASDQRAHWPCSPGPIQRLGRFYLCLAGTRSHPLFHPRASSVIGLGHLVAVLALAGRGTARRR